MSSSSSPPFTIVAASSASLSSDDSMTAGSRSSSTMETTRTVELPFEFLKDNSYRVMTTTTADNNNDTSLIRDSFFYFPLQSQETVLHIVLSTTTTNNNNSSNKGGSSSGKSIPTNAYMLFVYADSPPESMEWDDEHVGGSVQLVLGHQAVTFETSAQIEAQYVFLRMCMPSSNDTAKPENLNFETFKVKRTPLYDLNKEHSITSHLASRDDVAYFQWTAYAKPKGQKETTFTFYMSDISVNTTTATDVGYPNINSNNSNNGTALMSTRFTFVALMRSFLATEYTPLKSGGVKMKSNETIGSLSITVKTPSKIQYPIKLYLYIQSSDDNSVLSFTMKKPHGGSIWGLSMRDSIIMACSLFGLCVLVTVLAIILKYVDTVLMIRRRRKSHKITKQHLKASKSRDSLLIEQLGILNSDCDVELKDQYILMNDNEFVNKKNSNNNKNRREGVASSQQHQEAARLSANIYGFSN